MALHRSGRLTDKVAIVTGAGSGIGAATAHAMAAEGAAVVVADLNGGAADTVAAEITSRGGTSVAVCADVTDDDDVAAMIATATDRFGRFDVLHNNAGATDTATDLDITSTPDATWQFAYDVDLMGVVKGIRAAIPVMAANGGGSIINTASAGAFAGSTSLVAYAAAKAAVLAVTKYVVTTHGKQGIRCNSIAPGLVITPATRGLFPPQILDAIGRHQTMDGFIEADDVANLAVFLASDESRCITGQTIVIDAGIGAMGSAVPAITDAVAALMAGTQD